MYAQHGHSLRGVSLPHEVTTPNTDDGVERTLETLVFRPATRARYPGGVMASASC